MSSEISPWKSRYRFSSRYRTSSFTEVLLLMWTTPRGSLGRAVTGGVALGLPGRRTRNGQRAISPGRRLAQEYRGVRRTKAAVQRHCASTPSPGSWQTKQGRGFRRNCVAQPAAKLDRCGLKPPPMPCAAVADDAVALDVAGNALVQVLFGLERVVARLARRVAPDFLRGVEAPALADGRAGRSSRCRGAGGTGGRSSAPRGSSGT